MIREQKNKFWLTLILILSLSFSAFALGVASVVNNRKTNKPIFVEAAETPNYVEDKSDGWIKDGTTDVSKIGIMRGGTTISVETATDLNNNDNWHSELKVTIDGTNAETNGTYQPKIQNGYRLAGFHFYANGTKYGDLFEAGETATTEQIDPSYTGKIEIKAVCEPIEYKAYLYYSTDGEKWYEQEPTIFTNEEDYAILTSRTEQTTGVVRVFNHWAVKKDLVTIEDDVLKVNGTGITLAYYSEGQNLIKEIKNESNVTIYYAVNRIKGYSSKIHNFLLGAENDGKTTYNYSENPDIRATWSYLYNGLISNTSNNADFDQSKIIDLNGDGRIDDEDEKLLVGAYSTEDTDGNYKTAELEIAYADNYKYKFMENSGVAFAQLSDFNSNDDVKSKICSLGEGVNKKEYYVYNYGSEIIGWKIYFNNGTSDIYLKATSDGWEISSSLVENSNEALLNTNTADLASFCETLDNYFISGYPNTTIIMEPVWEKVKIDVKNSGTSIVKDNSLKNYVEYGSNYTISDSLSAPAGQMIYYYQTTSQKVIAKNHDNNAMPWNYVNIPHNNFSNYDSSTKTYTLIVEPVCVDNIYKVDLKAKDEEILYNTKQLVSGTYSYTYQLTKFEELSDSRKNQYQFASGQSANEFNIINVGLGFENYTSTYGSIENYIKTIVVPVKTTYSTSISNGSLDILRKVYTNINGATGLGATTTNAPEYTAFHIYLANDQPTGYLPVFEKPYYSLISWDNDASIKNPKEFAYPTQVYNNAKAADAADKAEFDADLSVYSIKADSKWLYSEMNPQTANLTLNAHYFRKNYLLDLNTLRETLNNEGRYGYIYVNIDDKTTADDKNGEFVAVFDGEQMQYYNVATLTATIGKKPVRDIAVDGEYDAHNLIKLDNGVYYIQVYAGCDLTIKASCVDNLTNNDASDLSFKDMVGYTLTSVKTAVNGDANNNLFDNFTDTGVSNHSETLNASSVEGKNYPNKSKITIDAYFAPIDYNIKISLKTNGTNNPFAGRVDCWDKTTTEKISEFTLIGNVENFSYIVEYFANAGYTLSESAITTNDKGGIEHILLSYNKDLETSETNKQEYALNLNGEWLIKNYYTSSYDASSTQDIGISVNTELLTFDYVIEIVDEETRNLLSTYTNGTMQLNGDKTAINIALITLEESKSNVANNNKLYDYVSRNLVANEFSQIADGQNLYVVKILQCETDHEHTADCYKNYAILSSELNQIFGGNNYNKEYDFPLTNLNFESPTEDDLLTQSDMNSIFGSSTIVKPADRKLIMQINVSELYTITLKSQKHETYADPNLTDRTTTIKNHDIGFAEYINEVSLTNGNNSDFTETQVIYTYKGVENVIFADFNQKMYTKAVYRLGNSASNLGEINLTNISKLTFALDETKVDANGNIILNITYVPKPITVFDVTYILNGTEVSSFDSSIFTDTKPSSIEVYYGEAVTYEYNLAENADYNVSVTLNGVKTTANPINCVVNESTYNSQGFYIIVRLTSVPKYETIFQYVLVDSDKGFADDNYGSFEVLVGENPVDLTSVDDKYLVSIPNGRKVEIDISNLAKGYHFVRLNRINSTIATTAENNKILVTESFNSNVDKSTYYIYIDKDTIQAKLSVSSSYANEYVMSSSGVATIKQSSSVSIVNAYLGKTLEFTNVDIDREKLDYYYWTDKTGTEHKIETLNVNGKYTLQLTSTLLEMLADKVDGVYTLNIGVKTISKYNLTYNVVNSNYAENCIITLDDNVTEYVSGTNLLNGTQLLLNVVVKDKLNAEGEIVEAKYDIELSGCVNQTYTNGKVQDLEIVLDADKTLTITIVQKAYTSSDSVYLYSNIDDYNNLTPDSAEQPIENIEISSELKYKNTETAKINTKIADFGELAVIRLLGNDQNTLVVHIKDKQIISIYDETANKEYAYDVTNAKHCTSENVLEVTNLTDKLKEYGYNLSFANGDIVDLSFVVNNTITIETQYLSYKTITIL